MFVDDVERITLTAGEGDEYTITWLSLSDAVPPAIPPCPHPSIIIRSGNYDLRTRNLPIYPRMSDGPSAWFAGRDSGTI